MAVVIAVCGRQTTQIQIQIHVTLLGIEENAPYLVDDYRYTLMMKCVLSRFFLRQTIFQRRRGLAFEVLITAVTELIQLMNCT